MKRSEHPSSCAVCGGTGWQPGPPIPSAQHGRPFQYSTVEPCTHHWSGDDPNPDLFTESEYQRMQVG